MSELTVAEVLDGAADLLEKPGAWTRQAFARDAQGKSIANGNNPNAVCWCVEGAFDKVLDSKEGWTSSADDFFSEIIGRDVADWNDDANRTQAEVVAKLREAAALAREQQA